MFYMIVQRQQRIIACLVLGTTLSVSDYGNLWKMDGPTEICKEDKISLDENCGDEVRNEIA